MGAMGHMHRAKAEAGVSMGARRDFDVMTLAQVCVPGLCWKCWNTIRAKLSVCQNLAIQILSYHLHGQPMYAITIPGLTQTLETRKSLFRAHLQVIFLRQLQLCCRRSNTISSFLPVVQHQSGHQDFNFALIPV